MNSLHLSVCRLEDRSTPATFGIPWGDTNRVTVSFVPDGTPVNGAGSNLFQMFQQAGIPAATGQGEILKALQTWAAHTPADLVLVADQGQALGVSGATQGDTRFGDIRIAARPMATNVLAVTEPPGSAGDTRQGDIVLNSNMLFNTAGAGGYDLFSAMLQEAGHAFGMGNSDDPASPMYEQYSGARQGLTSGDISNVQAIYGTRPADTFEHSSGNETLGTAAPVASASSHRAGAWVFSADLSTPADADAYRFVMPSDVTAGQPTSVQLATTGVSLANARLRVSDDRQQLIGEATDSHFAAALTVAIPNSQPGKTYFFSVTGVDSSAFAVGGYRVKLVFDPAGPEATVTGDNVPARQGSNNLLGSALSLVTPAGYDSHSYYRVNGRLDLPLLADWYKFQSAPVNGQAQSVAVVTVRTLEAGGRPPVIAVTDSQGRSLNAELVSSTVDAASYQFFAPADQTLYLKVATNGLLDLAALGAYQVEVSFRNVRIDFQDLAQGTLNPNATTTRSITLAQPALTKFSLAADGGGLLGQMSVRLVLKDAAGHEVARLTVPAGQTQTLSVWLEPGTYTASVTAFKSSGLLSAPVNFTLKYLTLTDPVGSQPTDSTGTPLPYPGTRPPSTVPSDGSGGSQSTGNPPPPPPPSNPPPQPPPPSSSEPPQSPPPPPENQPPQSPPPPPENQPPPPPQDPMMPPPGP